MFVLKSQWTEGRLLRDGWAVLTVVGGLVMVEKGEDGVRRGSHARPDSSILYGVAQHVEGVDNTCNYVILHQ